jgi:MFS family permease
LYILPTVVVQAFVGVAAGYYMNLTGKRLSLVYAGMLLMTLGFGLFITFSPSTALPKMFAIEATAGIGVGLVFQAPLLVLQSRTRPEHLAAGTALFDFVRSISTTVSIVVGGVVFQNGMNRRVEHLRSSMSFDLLPAFLGNSAVANTGLISKLDETQKRAVVMAYGNSLRDVWMLYACAAAFGLLSSFAIKSKAFPADFVDNTSKPQSPCNGPSPEQQDAIELESQQQA